jgi:hypothetical protein
MRAETIIDEHEAEEMHEAMDYAQHEGTWAGFTTAVKWTIIEMSLLMIALYAFIEAHNPTLGVLLLIVAILAIPGSMLFGKKS